MNRLIPTALAAAALLAMSCAGDPPSPVALPADRVQTDLTHLKDSDGRYVFLHGVNLSGSTKVPKAVDGKELLPTDLRLPSNMGKPSYVGKPWDVTGCAFAADGTFDAASEPACEAAKEFKKLRRVGFNVFRFLLNWEGIEPDQRGQYDQAYLLTIAKHAKIAEHYGVYLLLDMHQDSYSRHLVAMYNEKPSYVDDTGKTVYPARGSIENMVLSLVPPYTDAVRGEGAPKWAVKACLFEKNMDAETWGVPRLVSGISDPSVNLSSIIDLLTKLLGGGDGGGPAIPPWVNTLLDKVANDPLLQGVAPMDTSDLLPFTNWGLMSMTSIDTARNFACLLSGFFGDDDPYHRGGAFKKHYVTWNGAQVPVSRFLQDAYAEMWRQVPKALKAFNGGTVPRSIIGYDIINEPNGNFITMSAAAAIFSTGLYQSAQETLVGLLGKETGNQIFDLLAALRLLPVVPAKPDEPVDPGTGATAEQKAAYQQAKTDYTAALADWQAQVDAIAHDWGFQYTDLFGTVGLNLGYDRTYMSPFYEVVGRPIFEEDPGAVIWFEPAMSIGMVLSTPGGMWDQGMTKPHICRCEDPASASNGKAVACDADAATCGNVRMAGTVYEPHYYADIYPFLGFNVPSRDFTPAEVKFREYDDGIAGNFHIVDWNLEKIPAVLGEFGTYYNFGGIRKSSEADYEVSSQILDNYYESLERLMMHRILWCYTPDNDPRYGDWWNKEDFSIWQGWKDLQMDTDIGLAKSSVTSTAQALADGSFRCAQAWSRPYPMFLAGKPVSMHFYSPFHYFDPDKGEVPPEREFELVYEAKESSSPTEIFVPEIQYPDGFYVWLSDGYAYWDEATRTLYHQPTNDDPGAVHSVRLMPPLAGRPAEGWQYFIRGTEVVARN
jgi:hypothetical protein